jgi:NAD(P)-dependent dehydrogenase (short-subunit alcohol dehydrogenase family)
MTRQDVAIVTGAASGIGLAIATALSRRGFIVHGTTRAADPPAQRDGIRMLRLDVCSDDSVAASVGAVLRESGRLDVLVNSAGYQLMGALEETTLDEAKAQFETNFWGAVRMTNAVLPTMRRQRSGRIVNVSSVFGFMGPPFMGFYCASKHALEGYTEVLRHEVRPFGVSVSCVEPSAMRTRINAANRYARRIDDYAAARERALDFVASSVDQSGDDPSVVARVVVRIVESAHPRLRYTAGRQAAAARLARLLLPQSVAEKVVRKTFRLT